MLNRRVGTFGPRRVYIHVADDERLLHAIKRREQLLGGNTELGLLFDLLLERLGVHVEYAKAVPMMAEASDAHLPHCRGNCAVGVVNAKGDQDLAQPLTDQICDVFHLEHVGVKEAGCCRIWVVVLVELLWSAEHCDSLGKRFAVRGEGRLVLAHLLATNNNAVAWVAPQHF
eukprot:3426785-Prymnesium_polylepis.2